MSSYIQVVVDCLISSSVALSEFGTVRPIRPVRLVLAVDWTGPSFAVPSCSRTRIGVTMTQWSGMANKTVLQQVTISSSPLDKVFCARFGAQ